MAIEKKTFKRNITNNVHKLSRHIVTFLRQKILTQLEATVFWLYFNLPAKKIISLVFLLSLDL